MFETIIVDALKTLDPDVYSNQLEEALIALITVEDADVRWTIDGTTPTSSIGHKAQAGGVISLNSFKDIQKFQIINVSGTAKLAVTYDADSSQSSSAAGDITVDLVQTDVDALIKPHHDEDTIHTNGDTGTLLLGVRQDNAQSLVDTDGDYAPFTVSEHGCTNVDPQHYHSLDSCEDHTTWTVLGNDTDNKADSLNHTFKTNAITFDKVNGAANTVFAGIQKTITSFSANKFIEEAGGFLLGSMYFTTVPDNLNYAFIRLGTDASNYNEWRVSGENLNAGWDYLRAPLPSPGGTAGNGWDSSAVTYIAIGVAMDAEDDTLSGIIVDNLFINSGLQTSADIVSNVTSILNTNNINVQKVANKVVDTEDGNVSTGTQRITIADDDTNLAAINASVDDSSAIAASGQHLDNAGAGTAANTDYTVTVVALAHYTVHARDGVMYLGIADSTSDANILWTVPAGGTRTIKIPSGTSLHYSVDTAGVEGRLARIV